jgi:hypothetical protein
MVWPGPAAPRGEAAVIRSVSDSTRVVSLSEDITLVVRGALGETTIGVSGGHVEFLSSPCPHKICVERGRAALQGDYIVCVPNGVSVRITGESAFDAVVP